MLKKRFFKTNDECEVTFEFANATAQEVAVVGEFNDWQPVAMKKLKGNEGLFRTRVRMPKEAEFQFRYLVDGESWLNDEGADGYRPNEYGAENSVVSTHPDQA